MLTLDFPGSRRMIDSIDAAVAKGNTRDITQTLRLSLCDMMHGTEVSLPDCVFEPNAEHYARRELYRSEKYGYCIVAMTWAPGQGTPIHDHDGMWCVEGVWHGTLDIEQYELTEHDDQRYRFQNVGSIRAGTGSAGSLIPPHEYHSIRNPSTSDVTVSLHVYAGPMVRCAVFEPLKGDVQWYERNLRQLGLDRVH